MSPLPPDHAWTAEAARPSDADAIAELLRRNRHVKTLLLVPAAVVRRAIDEHLVVRSPIERELLGCVRLCWHRRGVAEVMSVAVDPDHRGVGIGSALVHAAVRRGTSWGADLIWLATTSPCFFGRLGFEEVPMRAIPLSVLLGKLAHVVRQPPRRWAAAIGGRQVFMRWPLTNEA